MPGMVIGGMISLLLVTALTAQTVELPRGTAVPMDCSLSVAFASYGTGIDRPTREKVQRLLEGDRSVHKLEAYPWGREGEVTFCARTRTKAQANTLFSRVKAALPRTRKPAPPITLTTRAGRKFQTGGIG